MTVLKEYPILSSKVPYVEFRRAVAFSNLKKLPLFTCPCENLQEHSLCNFIYSKSQEILLKMVEFQLREKKEIFVVEVLSDLVLELMKVKEDRRLTEKDRQKVDIAIRNLDEISFSFQEIRGIEVYFPQVTMDTTYFRLYYHPTYSMKEKALERIFKSGFLKEGYYAFKFDVNGALIRTALKLLALKREDNSLLSIAEGKEDIYKVASQRYKLEKEYEESRDRFKQELIKVINKGKSEILERSELLQRDLQELHSTYDINLIRKYMTIYCLNKVSFLQEKNPDGFIFLLNLDGGIFISKEGELRDLPKPMKYSKIGVREKASH